MVASLLAFAILIGVCGFRQPGGVRETDHALRSPSIGTLALDATMPASIGDGDDGPSPDQAGRLNEPARKRPRSGPSAVGEPAEAVALRGPAANAHLLADGAPVTACDRDVVAGLRGRAPPAA